MRNKLARVKNVTHFASAYKALEKRDSGIPGMGLVYGFTGSGKSTTVAWIVNQCYGIYVRATSLWTPSAMMSAILTELGIAPLHGCAKMLAVTTECITKNSRPLFVDEADYLLGNLRMLEALRDIHDLTGVPVVLIGMAGIERKLVHRKQLSRRISQWIEFQPCDLEDTELLAETVCEVKVHEDLLSRLHKEANGSIGLMTVGLSRIEAYAKTQRWHAINAEQWRDQPFFLKKVG